MNFTGQHRRRIINLGGRNVGDPNSRQAVLNKAQHDRERRAQARKEALAATTIQRFFRAKSQLALDRIRWRGIWDQLYLDSEPDRLTSAQIQHCVRLVPFFWRTDAHSDKSDARVALIDRLVRTADLAILSKPSLQGLIEALSMSLDPASFRGSVIIGVIDRVTLHVPGSEAVLQQVVAFWVSGTGNTTGAGLTDPWDCLLHLAQALPTQFLLHVLTIPHLFSHPQPLAQVDRLLHTIKEPLGPDFASAVESLALASKVALLQNTLQITDGRDRLTVNVLVVLDAALASIYADAISEKSPTLPDKSADDSEDDPDSADSAMAHRLASTLQDPTTVQAVERLCSRQFMASVFSLLQAAATPDVVNVIASFYVWLSRLFPDRRQTVLLYLSSASTGQGISAAALFWQSFVQSDTFIQGSAAILRDQQLIVLSQSDVGAWSRLMLSLDLYSYWLIITNDDEIFDPTYGLALAQVQDLITFLKNICFSFIWHWPGIQEAAPSPVVLSVLAKMKASCMLVLKQLYTRDSRRPFLSVNNPGFWWMTQFMDLSSFMTTVVDEERRKMDDDNGHTDSDPISTFWSTASSYTPRAPPPRVVASRLELLTQAPFFVPFASRVELFHKFISLDPSGSYDAPFRRPSVVEIKRGRVLEDAFEAFGPHPEDLKTGRHRINFINEHGEPEAGIDGGGLTKELLTQVCIDGFSLDQELFVATSNHTLYPNPALGVQMDYDSDEVFFGNYDRVSEPGRLEKHGKPPKVVCRTRQESLTYIRFLGNVIGKCLKAGILVNVEFAPFFLQKCSGIAKSASYRNSFDDLYDLDREIYNNLVKLRKYTGDIGSLDLTFSIVQELGHNRSKLVNLVRDGENVAVTRSNLLQYIHAVSDYKLNSSLRHQSAAFFQGVSDMLSLNWLSMFNAHELQMLISGGEAALDLADLKHNIVYSGFSDTDQTICDLWEVLSEMDEPDRAAFVKFVTSVPKAPLMGFKMLTPRFAVHNAGEDMGRLPTASTCVNMLKLPDYKNKRVLRDKLLYSVRSGAGFDLS